jgi:hypothetical protein
MDNDYLKILITVITAVVGWIAAHYFNTLRDRSLKRKEIITSHLINAYRILTNDVTKRDLTQERKLKLENVIADIQLFGSTEQIKLAKKLTDDIIANNDFPLDDLINNLRSDLRCQLGLKAVEGNVRWVRFDDKPPNI